MGWSAWALEHIGWVAGGSFAVSLLLHFAIVWLFKHSGKPANAKPPSRSEDDETP